MCSLKLILHMFVYLSVLCQVAIVFCVSHGPVSAARGNPIKEVPCSVCPRHGRCVPKIQCPARLRQGAFNPECHLQKQLGVCCFTNGHAAESDLQLRSSATNAEDVKEAHRHSHRKLANLLKRANELIENQDTIVNVTAPSFAHHMSMVSNDPMVEELSRGGLLNMFATEELKARDAISDDDLALSRTGQADGPYCLKPPSCPAPSHPYRSIGGECNNLAFPSWGAVNTVFERILPPDYSDGIWGMKASHSGLPLPSARTVSATLVLDGSYPSPTHSLMFMQFGQFIAHDISAGVMFTIGNGSAISCCSNDGEDFLPPELQHWACAPIPADPQDTFYGLYRHKCLNFVRSQLAPTSDCSVGYAKQMNGATHYPDLSHLYGSSDEKLSLLRGPGGMLKVFNDYGRELPPLTQRKECLGSKGTCFESGDSHGNQVISLTVFHTIFTREHNRLARALSRLNPDWSDERVFWESRRILQAEFQHVIYNEWLPLLLGPEIMQTFHLSPTLGYTSKYDSNMNPSLTTEFATAAMRFGHSIVDGKLSITKPKSGEAYETISIPEVMFQPSRLRLRFFLDRLLTGLSWQPMQNVDPFVTEGLTRYLFHGDNPFGLDLASINIQRGRDWGVRSYNDYRQLIGLSTYTDFQQFKPNTAQRLSSVYSTPEDIDLWIGGLLEEPVEGGVVGPIFANIIADQFDRLKRGDRYFYENAPDVNPGAFTPSQLAEIKKVTLSRIICDNKDGVELFVTSPNSFLRADLPGNEPVPCDGPHIPGIDLSRFKDM